MPDHDPSEIHNRTDLSLQHLEAELARIDLLLNRQIFRWQMANQDQSDIFRGLYVSDDEAHMLLQRPLGTTWGHLAVANPGAAEEFEAAAEQLARRTKTIVARAKTEGHSLRLEHLVTTFELNSFEVDTLLICLAPALDLRYEKIYGYLQDDVSRKRPSVALVMNVLCENMGQRFGTLDHFRDDAKLFRYHFLQRSRDDQQVGQSLLSQPLTIDESLVAWLTGKYQPHGEMGDCVALTFPEHNERASWISGGNFDKEEWLSLLNNQADQPVIAFYGPDRLYQDAAANELAAIRNCPLLTINLATALEHELSPMIILRMALRDARLTGSIPYLTDWQAFLIDGVNQPSLLSELCAYPGLIIVGASKQWRAQGDERTRRLHWLSFPVPCYRQRLALWKYFLHEEVATNRPIVDVLAGQFQLTSALIRDAVASAKDLAVQRGDCVQDEDLLAAARMHSNPRSGVAGVQD